MSRVGTYSVIYTATDVNGNSATKYRTVIVEDTTGPVITVDPPNPYTLEASANAYVDEGKSIYDVADPDVVINTNIDNVNYSVVGTYSVVYTATDVVVILLPNTELL